MPVTHVQGYSPESQVLMPQLMAFCLFVHFCYYICFCCCCFYFFLVFWGMGGEGRSINQKEYWGFEGELHIIISAGQRNWEVFCIGWGGGAQRCNCKLQVLEK